MKLIWNILLLIFLFSTFIGCTTSSSNPQVTVTSLDPGDIPQEQVGNFDIYTESFLIENPTNLTFENVAVDIKLQPTATYCHGITKSFDFPQLFPRRKKSSKSPLPNSEISIANIIIHTKFIPQTVDTDESQESLKKRAK